MSEYYREKEEKLNFKVIILGHYNKILEIARHEFIGGYKDYITLGTAIKEVYIGDKRKEFIQAVEIMALALFPHLDSDARKALEKYESKQKDILKKYVEKDTIFIRNDPESSQKYAIELLEESKLLFKAISILLHKRDYLNKRTFTQTSKGDIVEKNSYED